MSNPVSLFERLNKEKPKEVETLKLEVLQNSTSLDKYGQDKTRQVEIRQNKNLETSPTKNFTKTSNSIIKQAIPEKYFRGQSKHTYDVLYHRTRGAVVPVRQTQLSKTELVKLTGLAEKTVQLHIRYLRDARLIAVHPQMGSRNGWIYEVFIPEEVDSTLEYGQDKISMDRTGMDKIGRDKSRLNLSSQTMQNLSLLDHSNTVENKELNDVSKTLLNTDKNTDDDALAYFAAKMNEVSRKITNKNLSENEKGKWGELAELLGMELEIAAARTNSISSVPAFLTEHLRRRLFSKAVLVKEKVKSDKSTRTNSQKNVVEEYKAEPLAKQGREAVLKTMREYIEKGRQEFVISQQDTYTTEDWKWLMDKLEGVR